MSNKSTFSSLREAALKRLSRMGANKDTPVDDHAGSRSDEPAFRRFRDLPPEIRSTIVAEAALANPDGLLAGANTLRQVSKAFSEDLMGNPHLRKVANIAPEAAALANHVQEKMYPRDGLPEHEVNRQHRDEPLYAFEHVENSLRNWKLLSSEEQSRVVDDVVGISDFGSRMSSILEFSKHSDALKTDHGRRILSDAIKLFGETPVRTNSPRTSELFGRQNLKSTASAIVRLSKPVEESPNFSERQNLKSLACAMCRLQKHAGHEEISQLNKILHRHPARNAEFIKGKNDFQSEALQQSEVSHEVASRDGSRNEVLPDQWHENIVKIIDDHSLTELEKSSKVYSSLDKRLADLKSSAPALRIKLMKSMPHVPGDNRAASLARASLAETPRDRSDHVL